MTSMLRANSLAFAEYWTIEVCDGDSHVLCDLNYIEITRRFGCDVGLKI